MRIDTMRRTLGLADSLEAVRVKHSGFVKVPGEVDTPYALHFIGEVNDPADDPADEAHKVELVLAFSAAAMLDFLRGAAEYVAEDEDFQAAREPA